MQQAEGGRGGEPVGKSTMDAEHELLHGVLDDLKAELASDGPRVRELATRLEEVAGAHFLEEQSLMRLHAYPAYEAHQNEHDELMEELLTLTARVREGEAVDAARLAGELDRWFQVHMNTTDAVLEEYLQEKGIRGQAGPQANPPRPGWSAGTDA